MLRHTEYLGVPTWDPNFGNYPLTFPNPFIPNLPRRLLLYITAALILGGVQQKEEPGIYRAESAEMGLLFQTRHQEGDVRLKRPELGLGVSDAGITIAMSVLLGI